MVRNIILAVAGIAAAVILAPTVDAAPKFCDAHGGHVYIHACAGGGGGGGQDWTPTSPSERAAQLAHIHDVFNQLADRLNGTGH